MTETDDLASGMENLNVHAESSPPSEPSEQPYKAIRQGGQVTQRRPRTSASNFRQQAKEKMAKSRASFNASASLQLDPKATHDDKVDFILQKIREQKKCMNTLIEAQRAWNRSFEDHITRTDTHLKIIHSGMDNLKSSVDALTQSIGQINAHMNDLVANQHRPTQQSRQRPPHRSPSQSSTESIDWLVNEKERFKDSDIGYFNPNCSETHGKGDYVTIGDKMHYRDVWLFIDSAQAIASTKGSKLVRLHLHKCLRGRAQAWYIAELTKVQRLNLISGHGLHH